MYAIPLGMKQPQMGWHAKINESINNEDVMKKTTAKDMVVFVYN